MDTRPSGEDLTLKRRKPYTITKQREKWTEEEHSKFIKALKLYGRAWQRIQEYVGTKSAVQIRSHAQKFFSKLEKEALAKGTTVAETHEIEIPPPRPKRKPNCPNPKSVADGGSLRQCSEPSKGEMKAGASVDVSEDASDKCPWRTEMQQREQIPEAKNSLELRCFFQLAPSSSISSAGMGSSSTHALEQQIVPSKGESSYSVKGNKENKMVQGVPARASVSSGDYSNSKRIMGPMEKDGAKQTKFHADNFPVYERNVKAEKVVPSHENDRNSIHQRCMSFLPFPQPGNVQESGRPLIPSACHGLTAPILSNDQAIQAAANLAFSFWPPCAMNALLRPDAFCGSTLQHPHINLSPNFTAMAHAPAEAASAWWASHALLPTFPPFHPSYILPPGHPVPFSAGKTDQPLDRREQNELDRAQNEQRKLGVSESLGAVKTKPACSESLSTLQSEEKGKDEASCNGKIALMLPKKSRLPICPGEAMQAQRSSQHSSNGSNTSSGSDVGTRTVMTKHSGVDQSENMQLFQHRHDERINSNCRCLGGVIVNEKNLEEGHRASSEQLGGENGARCSLWLQTKLDEELIPKKNEDDAAHTIGKISQSSSGSANRDQEECSMLSEDDKAKLKISHSAFKPYKRCCSSDANICPIVDIENSEAVTS